MTSSERRDIETLICVVVASVLIALFALLVTGCGSVEVERGETVSLERLQEYEVALETALMIAEREGANPEKLDAIQESIDKIGNYIAIVKNAMDSGEPVRISPAKVALALGTTYLEFTE